jgi:hypothetical protein
VKQRPNAAVLSALRALPQDVVEFNHIQATAHSGPYLKADRTDQTCGIGRASRARGRVGSREAKPRITVSKLGATMLRMARLYTDVTDLCKDLSVTRHTWYRHVAPDGPIWPDVKKLQGVGQARHSGRVSAAVGD